MKKVWALFFISTSLYSADFICPENTMFVDSELSCFCQKENEQKEGPYIEYEKDSKQLKTISSFENNLLTGPHYQFISKDKVIISSYEKGELLGSIEEDFTQVEQRLVDIFDLNKEFKGRSIASSEEYIAKGELLCEIKTSDIKDEILKVIYSDTQIEKKFLEFMQERSLHDRYRLVYQLSNTPSQTEIESPKLKFFSNNNFEILKKRVFSSNLEESSLKYFDNVFEVLKNKYQGLDQLVNSAITVSYLYDYITKLNDVDFKSFKKELISSDNRVVFEREENFIKLILKDIGEMKVSPVNLRKVASNFFIPKETSIEFKFFKSDSFFQVKDLKLDKCI